MNFNFDRDPRNRKNRRKNDNDSFSFVFEIIDMFFDVVSYVIGGIISIIAGSKASERFDRLKRDLNINTEKKEKTNNNQSRRNRFGEIAALVFGILFILNGVRKIFEFLFVPEPNYVLSLTGVGLSLFVGIFLVVLSGGLKKSGKRREKIALLIGESEYFDLSALAGATDTSKRQIRRELGKMIDKGEFGDRAYIDKKANMFFISPEAAERYRLLREAFAEEKNESAKNNDSHTESRTDPDEYRALILEIRRLNDDIKDYAVSERIYRIEEHTQNIFDYVKEHPEKRDNIRTFMNYYLPTTMKLLASYAKIERVGVAGENMKRSKEDIEKTLDMLVYAFEKEVDMLFESESIDISSDIDVLETMLKRDGMTKGFGDEPFMGGAAAQSKPDDEIRRE